MKFHLLFIAGVSCLLLQGQETLRRDSIVVTGTYEPLPLEEVDRVVRSLPVRSDPIPVNAWADVLRLHPAVDLRSRAPNGVQGDLSIRGATFGQTLVLLDGLRLNDAQTGHHNLDIPVPLESITCIEVLQGAGSTLYGSDAIGGVVNFVTEPPEVSEIRLRGAAGNFGVNQQRVSLGLTSGRWSQQLAASRDFSSGFRHGRDYRNLSLASTTLVRSRLGTSSLLLAHTDRPFGAENFYGRYNSWEHTRTWFAAARQALGKNTGAAFGYRRHTDFFLLDRVRPALYSNRHAGESFQAALRRNDGIGTRARVYYGIEGFRDSIDSTNLGRHSRTRGAVYGTLDLRTLSRFSFSLGARQETYKGGAGQFSPSVSAGWWMNRWLKLRASAGRAFRLPSFTDLYYHDPANIGSPDLRPESAWNYEAGGDFHAGRFTATLAVFERRERDGIDYMRRSEDEIWRAANIHQLRMRGVEAAARAVLSRSHALDFGYTGLSGVQEALAGLQSKYVYNHPSHAGTASWSGALPGGVVARSRIGVLKRIDRAAYPLWDITAGLDRQRLRPFVQATNLTGSSYEEIAGVIMPGRGVIFGLEVVLRPR